jgi:hypothetical protein
MNAQVKNMAAAFAALDKIFAPSEATMREQERIAAVLARQRKDDQDYARYAGQRNLGFAHDKIIHLFSGRDLEHYAEWYREEQKALFGATPEDNVVCWPENSNAESCRVRDEVGMGSEFDAEPRG